MALMTHDEIKDTAPDRKAFAAAKKLADITKWHATGKEGQILWGTAVGSSGDHYAVYVDVSRKALECSCPSRKRPCKHSLALLILDANEAGIPDAPPPSDHRWEAEERYNSAWE